MILKDGRFLCESFCFRAFELIQKKVCFGGTADGQVSLVQAAVVISVSGGLEQEGKLQQENQVLGKSEIR